MIKKGFGKKIFEARNEKGFTQIKLADLLDVHKNLVNRWETGKAMPKDKNLRKLAKLLEKPIPYFFEDEGINFDDINHSVVAGKIQGHGNIVHQSNNEDFTNSKKCDITIDGVKKTIETLFELKEKGLLTEKEFIAKKTELLKRI